MQPVLKSLLGATTDTEAIDRALDLVLEEEVLNETLREVRAKGGLRAVFPDFDSSKAHGGRRMP